MRNKLLITVALIIILAGGAYFYLQSGESSQTELTSEGALVSPVDSMEGVEKAEELTTESKTPEQPANSSSERVYSNSSYGFTFNYPLKYESFLYEHGSKNDEYGRVGAGLRGLTFSSQVAPVTASVGLGIEVSTNPAEVDGCSIVPESTESMHVEKMPNTVIDAQSFTSYTKQVTFNSNKSYYHQLLKDGACYTISTSLNRGYQLSGLTSQQKEAIKAEDKEILAEMNRIILSLDFK